MAIPKKSGTAAEQLRATKPPTHGPRGRGTHDFRHRQALTKQAPPDYGRRPQASTQSGRQRLLHVEVTERPCITASVPPPTRPTVAGT